MKTNPPTPTTTPKRRCAIYTRKSHEEGLEQEFNSLDAQRESGEIYISSQKHEGWILLPHKYDDGGFSGATTERLALMKLLADIEAGQIDMVVVYKIDRLSRSLTDFVQLLELFERRGVAFASVTQQFNTANSMGRLILNVLICFAQFERENIAERIRDKVSASKRRGKWLGGIPPMGYRVDPATKRLVIVEVEAKIIRDIFHRFLQTRSPDTIARELREKSITTKTWTSKAGRTRQGKPIYRSQIHKILNQNLYVGEIAYKGENYPGEHPAIIGRELWDQVHAVLGKHLPTRPTQNRAIIPGFLKGVVRCGHCGSKMTMSYTRKRGRMYRYYRCVKVAKGTVDACPVSQVAAGDLENETIKHLRRVFRSPAILALANQESQKIAAADGIKIDYITVLEALRSVDQVWEELFPVEQERLVGLLIDRMVIGLDHSQMHLRLNGFTDLSAELGSLSGVEIHPETEIAIIRLGVTARHRSGRIRFIIPHQQADDLDKATEAYPLLAVIARAFRWQADLEAGRYPHVKALAQSEGIDESYVRRLLRLTLHSPKVIQDLLDGQGDLSSIVASIQDAPPEIWDAIPSKAI